MISRPYKAYATETARNGKGNGIGLVCKKKIFDVGECANVKKGGNKNKTLKTACQRAFVQCVHSRAKAKRKTTVPQVPSLPPTSNTIPPIPTTSTPPVDPNDPSIPEPTILDSIFKTIEELIAAVMSFFSGENK